MNATEKVRELQKLLAGLLCEIPISKAALPHTVFAEEEDEHGNPAFIRYRLTSINPTNGTCLLKDETGKETNRPLTDINTDWLAILLDRCYELMPRKKRNPQNFPLIKNFGRFFTHVKGSNVILLTGELLPVMKFTTTKYPRWKN